MSFSKEAPTRSLSVNDALKIVIGYLKKGQYGSVYEAINEMKKLTSNESFDNNVYKKLNQAWNE